MSLPNSRLQAAIDSAEEVEAAIDSAEVTRSRRGLTCLALKVVDSLYVLKGKARI